MNSTLTTGLLLGFLLAPGSVAVGQSAGTVLTDRDPRITVGVYDYAYAGPDVLLKAERAASGILLHAGVSIVWLRCPATDTSPSDVGCASPSGPLRFYLHIVTKRAGRQLRQKADAFGFAAQGGEGELASDAWVFYEDVKDSAYRTRLSLTQILGSVIAHELGHLLLGANSHSRTGLMRARWSRDELLAADLGEMSFSRSECERIRTSLLARR